MDATGLKTQRQANYRGNSRKTMVMRIGLATRFRRAAHFQTHNTSLKEELAYKNKYCASKFKIILTFLSEKSDETDKICTTEKPAYL